MGIRAKLEPFAKGHGFGRALDTTSSLETLLTHAASRRDGALGSKINRMVPDCDFSLGIGYSSASQRARVITEAWIKKNGYCLACKSDELLQTPPNTQARDFECSACGHGYELKSSCSRFGRRIPAGAYSSLIRRINNSTVSSLLLLHYTTTWQVVSLSLIHHSLITPGVIEQRKPLSATAQRAGWVGCNIRLGDIPPEGRIPLILDGLVVLKSEARQGFMTTENLSAQSAGERNWSSFVLRYLHKLGKEQFSVQEAYSMEAEISREFPENRHVKAKIRQQLQLLRDAGLLQWESRGIYRFPAATQLLRSHPPDRE